MEPQRASPFEGLFNFIETLPEALRMEHRRDVFTTDLGHHWLDTCCPPDTELWETAVQPKGEVMLIVEQYPNREAAQVGHDKWVKMLSENPDLPLADIDQWSLNALREG